MFSNILLFIFSIIPTYKEINIISSSDNPTLKEDIINCFFIINNKKINLINNNRNNINYFITEDNNYIFNISYIDDFSFNIIYDNYYYCKNYYKEDIIKDFKLLENNEIYLNKHKIITNENEYKIIYPRIIFNSKFFYILIIFIYYMIIYNINLKKLNIDI